MDITNFKWKMKMNIEGKKGKRTFIFFFERQPRRCSSIDGGKWVLALLLLVSNSSLRLRVILQKKKPFLFFSSFSMRGIGCRGFLTTHGVYAPRGVLYKNSLVFFRTFFLFVFFIDTVHPKTGSLSISQLPSLCPPPFFFERCVPKDTFIFPIFFVPQKMLFFFPLLFQYGYATRGLGSSYIFFFFSFFFSPPLSPPTLLLGCCHIMCLFMNFPQNPPTETSPPLWGSAFIRRKRNL